jgi:hypothetical protein
LVGTLDFGQAVLALNAAQTQLGREINPTVFSRREFNAKLKQTDGFVAQVWAGSKLWVLGQP